MKRRQSAAVELTPLLDVILIILFLIITENNAKTEEIQKNAESEISGYSAEIDSLKKTLSEKDIELSEKADTIGEMQNIISGFEDFEEISEIISVSVGRNAGSEARVIYVSDGKDTERICFDWDNLRYAENSLRLTLSAIIKKHDGKPVFISYSYDRETTYQRDYELISDALSEITDRNVFISVNENIPVRGDNGKDDIS